MVVGATAVVVVVLAVIEASMDGLVDDVAALVCAESCSFAPLHATAVDDAASSFSA
jgi:hypothetical protein